MYAIPMKIKKVHDLSSCDAVDDISNSTTKDQAQAQRLIAWTLCSQHQYQPC